MSDKKTEMAALSLVGDMRRLEKEKEKIRDEYATKLEDCIIPLLLLEDDKKKFNDYLNGKAVMDDTIPQKKNFRYKISRSLSDSLFDAMKEDMKSESPRFISRTSLQESLSLAKDMSFILSPNADSERTRDNLKIIEDIISSSPFRELSDYDISSLINAFSDIDSNILNKEVRSEYKDEIKRRFISYEPVTDMDAVFGDWREDSFCLADLFDVAQSEAMDFINACTQTDYYDDLSDVEKDFEAAGSEMFKNIGDNARGISYDFFMRSFYLLLSPAELSGSSLKESFKNVLDWMLSGDDELKKRFDDILKGYPSESLSGLQKLLLSCSQEYLKNHMRSMRDINDFKKLCVNENYGYVSEFFGIDDFVAKTVLRFGDESDFRDFLRDTLTAASSIPCVVEPDEREARDIFAIARHDLFNREKSREDFNFSRNLINRSILALQQEKELSETDRENILISSVYGSLTYSSDDTLKRVQAGIDSLKDFYGSVERLNLKKPDEDTVKKALIKKLSDKEYEIKDNIKDFSDRILKRKEISEPER